ncbi:MAG: hypothetical protein OEX12_05930 [Gammaproteobacteria bacterium]|nr:hypothetical protein [Gammaproteobacteria bacterium]
MTQTPDDSMDDFDTDDMNDSILSVDDEEDEEDEKPVKANSLLSRRRIEDLMERKRLLQQLNDDYYDMDLPEDL